MSEQDKGLTPGGDGGESPCPSPSGSASNISESASTDQLLLSISPSPVEGGSGIAGITDGERPDSSRGTPETMSVRARYKELKHQRQQLKTAPPSSPSTDGQLPDEQKILEAKNSLAAHVQQMRAGFRYGLAEEGYSALKELVQVPEYDEIIKKKPSKRKGRLSLSGIFSNSTSGPRMRAATVSSISEPPVSPKGETTEEAFKKSLENLMNQKSKPREGREKKEKDKFGSLKGGMISPRAWMEHRRNRSGTLTGVSSDLLDKLAGDGFDAKFEGKELTAESRSDSKTELRSPVVKKYHIFGVALNAELSEEELLPPFLQMAIQYIVSKPKAMVAKTFTSQVLPEDFEKAIARLEENKSTIDIHLHAMTPKLVGQLLIRYLDTLPEPIFTHRLVYDWYFVADIKDAEYRLQCLRLLFYSLPSLNRAVVEFIVVFLKKFKDVPTVAKVFGGAMLKPPPGEEKPSKTVIAPFLPPPLAQGHLPGLLLQHFVKSMDDVLRTDGPDFKFVSNSGGPLVITEATPEKLLELVTNPFYNEPDFRETFFSTHMYYVKTVDLPKMLFSIYEKPPKEAWQKVVRLRTVQVIKDWFGRHLNELVSNHQFTTSMRKLVDEYGLKCTDEESAYFLYITSLLQNVERHKPAATRNISFYFNEKIKTDKKPDYILNILAKEPTPQKIAQQLTLIDHDMLKSILSTEFLRKNFSKPELCSNFMAMADKFNTWSLWVPTEILKRPTAPERAEVIHQFIRIAYQCRRLRNFNTCYAIVAGLGNSSVSRLKQTWGKVHHKAKVKLNVLLELFEMSYNFKNYREALRVAAPPIIPYLGIFPKDLTSIEENNPDWLVPPPLPSSSSPSSITTGGTTNTTAPRSQHVNFVKMRLLYGVISQIYKSQHVQYNFDRDPKLRRYLKTMTILTDSEAHNASLIAEPRVNSTAS